MTAMYGKWHLEEPITRSTWPHNQGFNYVLGEKTCARLTNDLGLQYMYLIVFMCLYACI